MLRHLTILAALACVTGCAQPADVPSATADDPNADVAVCLEGEPFVEAGDIPLTSSAGDAERIGGIRWEAHEGCERLVIDLYAGEDEVASSPGAVSAEVLRDLGVVRIHLPGVLHVDHDATDSTFEGALADRAHAVRAPEGEGTFVDVHLAAPAEAHVALLESPARVVVDLRPGGGEIPPPAATHRFVVVLSPRPGEASYPLEVVGYARTFEANVVARLEQDGEEVFLDFTTATSWVDAWGHFEITIDDGPSGEVTLHVGEHSAKDGTWQGAQVELQMR